MNPKFNPPNMITLAVSQPVSKLVVEAVWCTRWINRAKNSNKFLAGIKCQERLCSCGYGVKTSCSRKWSHTLWSQQLNSIILYMWRTRWMKRVTDSISKEMGFNCHFGLCVEMLGKLCVPTCLHSSNSNSRNGYLVEQKMLIYDQHKLLKKDWNLLGRGGMVQEWVLLLHCTKKPLSTR